MPLGSRSRPANAPPLAEAAPEDGPLAPEAAQPPDAALAAEGAPPPAAMGRLGRWLPRLAGLVRVAYRVGATSAVSALVLWWALAGDAVMAGGRAWVPALLVLAALLVPAGAAWLLGLTLHDVLTLPETLRRSASAAAVESREALAASGAKGGRIAGLVRAVWAARGLVLESQGAWAKALAAARVVRLAKLPFALGLVGLFALNGVVIAAGLVALVVMLV